MTPSSVTVKYAEIGICFGHARLASTEHETIFSFLRKYDQYSFMLIARASQLTTRTLTTETIKPDDVKFCVDCEFLESNIAQGFIYEVKTYEELPNSKVWEFLEDRCKESKETITVRQLDKTVKLKLRTNMQNKMRRHLCKTCLQVAIPNLYVTDLLGRSKQTTRSPSNMSSQLPSLKHFTIVQQLALMFLQYELRKDFRGFLKHAIRLAKAFQSGDTGRNFFSNENDADRNAAGCRRGGYGGRGNADRSKAHNLQKDKLPLCL